MLLLLLIGPILLALVNSTVTQKIRDENNNMAQNVAHLNSSNAMVLEDRIRILHNGTAKLTSGKQNKKQGQEKNRKPIRKIKKTIKKNKKTTKKASNTKKKPSKKQNNKQQSGAHTCKQKPLQQHCINSKFVKRIKQIETKFSNHVSKTGMQLFETYLMTKMNKTSKLIRSTLEDKIMNNTVRCEATLAALAALKVNVTKMQAEETLPGPTSMTLVEKLNSSR